MFAEWSGLCFFSNNKTQAESVFQFLNRNNHNWAQVLVNGDSNLIDFWRTQISFGVSALSASCRAIYTLAHELGHNMGLFHDRYQYYTEQEATSYALYPYSFGYVNQRAFVDGSTSSCKYTMMAYSKQCRDNSAAFSLLQFFSNPSKMISGSQDPAGTSGESFTQTLTGPAHSIRAVGHAWRNLMQIKDSQTSCKNSFSLQEGSSNSGKRLVLTVPAGGETYSVTAGPDYCLPSSPGTLSTSTPSFITTTASGNNTVSIQVPENQHCSRSGTVMIQGEAEGSASVVIQQAAGSLCACNREEAVSAAILDEFPSATNCNEVTVSQLASITSWI